MRILADSSRRALVNSAGQPITDDLAISATVSGIELDTICVPLEVGDYGTLRGIDPNLFNKTLELTWGGWTCGRCGWSDIAVIPAGTAFPGCLNPESWTAEWLAAYRGSFWEFFIFDTAPGCDGIALAAKIFLFYGNTIGAANAVCLPLTMDNLLTSHDGYKWVDPPSGAFQFYSAVGKNGSVTIQDVCPTT